MEGTGRSQHGISRGLPHYANFSLEQESVGMDEWELMEVGVWACVCSSIINYKASCLHGAFQFIKLFTTIIPLSPFETL